MYLPSEWHQQAFVQMTWPHQDTDWAPMLADAIVCFSEIAKEVAKREPLLIVAQDVAQAQRDLQTQGVSLENMTFVACPTNDTWARDHAFITCMEDGTDKDCAHRTKGEVILKDFQFNGWGMKFAANWDNQINEGILKEVKSIYEKASIQANYENHLDFVLEGGSIESDGEGTLMVTTSCLLSKNRNSTLNQQDIELKLKKHFHANRVLWLTESWLAGDDTDGHIDTVARFCTSSSIAYVKCTEKTDEHYEKLKVMEQELMEMRTADGNPYTLYPLPLPDACFDEDGLRLPATYANFLIINGAVLVPTYHQPQKDDMAIATLKKAFPHHEVVGIDCRVLIWQHGSLHCSTMQFPTL